jgi:hypothetical protein
MSRWSALRKVVPGVVDLERHEDQPDVVKDRPVLVVGRKDGATVLGLMLSSKEHRADDANWLAIGSGPWDREQRPSYVRLDRVLELADDDGVGREGAVLDRVRFDRVTQAPHDRGGWQQPPASPR